MNNEAGLVGSKFCFALWHDYVLFGKSDGATCFSCNGMAWQVI